MILSSSAESAKDFNGKNTDLQEESAATTMRLPIPIISFGLTLLSKAETLLIAVTSII